MTGPSQTKFLAAPSALRNTCLSTPTAFLAVTQSAEFSGWGKLILTCYTSTKNSLALSVFLKISGRNWPVMDLVLSDCAACQKWGHLLGPALWIYKAPLLWWLPEEPRTSTSKNNHFLAQENVITCVTLSICHHQSLRHFNKGKTFSHPYFTVPTTRLACIPTEIKHCPSKNQEYEQPIKDRIQNCTHSHNNYSIIVAPGKIYSTGSRTVVQKHSIQGHSNYSAVVVWEFVTC